jgi:hypothetical protein
MFGIRGIPLLTVAALAVAGLGTISPLPAYATTLTVTSLGCEPRPAAIICEGHVSGGTGGNSYSWNPYSGHQSNSTDYSSTTIYCQVGFWYSVTMTVTDSSSATASKTISAYCSGGNP